MGQDDDENNNTNIGLKISSLQNSLREKASSEWFKNKSNPGELLSIFEEFIKTPKPIDLTRKYEGTVRIRNEKTHSLIVENQVNSEKKTPPTDDHQGNTFEMDGLKKSNSNVEKPKIKKVTKKKKQQQPVLKDDGPKFRKINDNTNIIENTIIPSNNNNNLPNSENQLIVVVEQNAVENSSINSTLTLQQQSTAQHPPSHESDLNQLLTKQNEKQHKKKTLKSSADTTNKQQKKKRLHNNDNKEEGFRKSTSSHDHSLKKFKSSNSSQHHQHHHKNNKEHLNHNNNNREPPVKDFCKFFLHGNCYKGESCPFSHDKKSFPCKFFHLYNSCKKGADACEFSHQTPLSDAYRQLLLNTEKKFADSKDVSTSETNCTNANPLPFPQFEATLQNNNIDESFEKLSSLSSDQQLSTEQTSSSLSSLPFPLNNSFPSSSTITTTTITEQQTQPSQPSSVAALPFGTLLNPFNYSHSSSSY